MTFLTNLRILRIILLLISICLISMPVEAKYNSGTGEPNNPYLIKTAEQLNTIGAEPNDWDKHFKLIANIDLIAYTGTEFNIIGYWRSRSDNKPFNGVFDGNDHTISNLTIVNDRYIYLGLFGYLSHNAEVKDLGVENIDITSLGTDIYAGGLVGYNSGTIINCSITGSVTGDKSVGGLVGSNNGGIIVNCYNKASVTGYWEVGGLIGSNAEGYITSCYSTGNVYSDSEKIGGLVGNIYSGTVISCYSTGKVHGDYQDVGGLVGYNNSGFVTGCYSTGIVEGDYDVGGLIGENWGTVWGCYSTGTVEGNRYVGGLIGDNTHGTVIKSFSIGTSEDMCSKGSCGSGKTTAEMQIKSTFIDAGWDFLGERENGLHEIWQMPATEGPPVLSIFNDYNLPLLSGEGTSESPYLISTTEELGSIVYREPEAYYELTQNINLSGIRWSLPVIPLIRVGFNGNGHIVSNLLIEGYTLLGFIGIVDPEAQISNLGITDANVTSSYGEAGILAGGNKGIITNCFSTGSARGTWGSGGLVGWSGFNNKGYVRNCYSWASASGSGRVGGLVGFNGRASVEYCYSTGEVVGDDDHVHVCGLIGDNLLEDNVIKSFSIGAFEDMCVLGSSGSSKTTAEMKTTSTFLEAGWNIVDKTANGTDNIWWIDEGNGYPRLWWELVEE